MVSSEQYVHRLLEIEGSELEDLAADWISEKEPRYLIFPRSDNVFVMDATFGVSYEGRLFIFKEAHWTPINKWVEALVFQTQMPWKEARQWLESKHQYFGFVLVTSQYKGVGANRVGSLYGHPVHMKKIEHE
jgi:hypothetical protein